METTVTRQVIEEVVLGAMTLANQSRTPDKQLEVSPEAPIFGRRSSLDSLALVALLIDVEDMLRDRGLDVTLSDERAMSQKKSPFRDVPSLVDYIATIAAAPVE